MRAILENAREDATLYRAMQAKLVLDALARDLARERDRLAAEAAQFEGWLSRSTK